MKQFLAIYMGSQTSPRFSDWNAMEESKRKQTEKAGIEAWGQWMKTHEKSIVFSGGPLGKTKRVDPNGITDTKNNLTGYVVVRAESQQAAAEMFLKHPHFAIFPGDSVEIMECLPIPGQT